MNNTGEAICAIIMLLSGLYLGDNVGTKTFIDMNYGKEFTVIEKTIKADEFSYKITDGKEQYEFDTKDDLEMSSVITIGVKWWIPN